MSKTTVGVLKDVQGIIGKGWIRKLLNIPQMVTEEEYEEKRKKYEVFSEKNFHLDSHFEV